jgi:MFS superfamily sulfate permease-like transporter
MSVSRSLPPPAKVDLIKDVKSGFLVFLIALPLCLGISIASGFPPVAGVLTAIIGGVLGSIAGGARLTIKGPAAGLIAIAIGSVQDLGHGDMVTGYKRTLAVGVVAACVQLAFALLGTATAGIAMSPSVVHGMLAAIGVIIISKQSHTLLGVKPDATEPFELLAELPRSITSANPEVVTIGMISLVILFGLPWVKTKWVKMVPAPMVVLAVAVPLGLWFDLDHPHTYSFLHHEYKLGPNFLVNLPGSLVDAVAFPDFSQVTSATSIKYIVMFALVGTIESTLSVLAVDSMDPQKRASNLNRDLLATSVGNLLAACIGGLPMISEIVRSKANVDSGATSRWSNFAHGIFLLLFVSLIPGLLHHIPLAALAAMLVFTGTRLASPKEFAHAKHVGIDQLVLFCATLLVTLATDLLVGVGAGLLLKTILHGIRGASPATLFRTRVEETRDGDTLTLTLHGAAAFPCLLAVKRAFNRVDESVREVVLDIRDVVIVDHTFMSRIESMADELPSAQWTLIGADEFTPVTDHPHSARRKVLSRA